LQEPQLHELPQVQVPDFDVPQVQVSHVQTSQLQLELPLADFLFFRVLSLIAFDFFILLMY